MLDCIIVDDEPSCIEILQLMLQKKFSETVNIVATTTNPLEAGELILKHKPELVFLDIEMPRLSGLALLESLEDIDFHIIFTTAHQHYALQAIKLNALDYLLKPFTHEELGDGLKKCMARNPVSKNMLNELMQRMKTEKNLSRKIAITSDNITRFFPVNDILHIEANSNYCTIYFSNKTKIITAKTLKEFESQLAELNFYRVHNSHLINIAHIAGYKNLDSGYVIMNDNTIIEISRRKKAELLKILQNL